MSTSPFRLILASLALSLAGCDLLGTRTVSTCGCVPYRPLAGKWSDRETSPNPTLYQILEFLPDNAYTSTTLPTDSSSGGDIQEDDGTWHVVADTLFLEFETIWKDASGKKRGPPSPKPVKTRQRFRINDSGWLATTSLLDPGYARAVPEPSVWRYFRPADGQVRDRGYPVAGATAASSHDTDIAVLDTVRFVAVPGDPSKPPVRYLWSFNGGESYPFTSQTGEMRWGWPLDQHGLHVVAVRGVDGAGQASDPWYFEVRVHN